MKTKLSGLGGTCWQLAEGSLPFISLSSSRGLGSRTGDFLYGEMCVREDRCVWYDVDMAAKVSHSKQLTIIKQISGYQPHLWPVAGNQDWYQNHIYRAETRKQMLRKFFPNYSSSQFVVTAASSPGPTLLSLNWQLNCWGPQLCLLEASSDLHLIRSSKNFSPLWL